MRFMVTGGAGFIGSHLIRLLIDKGHEVVIYDNLSTGKLSNIPDSALITFIQGDIRDMPQVEKAMVDCDIVIHLAALVSVTKSVEHPDESKSHNIDGLFTVLEAARNNPNRIKKFVLASSAAVYGSPAHIPIKETEQVEPLSPYGLEKLVDELYLRLYSSLYQLPGLALRFFNVYGERQDPKSPYSGVISIFTDKRKNHQPLTVFGDGHQTRDFIYVGQLVSCIYELAISPEEGIYNVGTGKSTSINALIETLDAILGTSGLPIEHKPPRPGDIKESVADISQLASRISLNQVPLEEGLQRMLAGLEQGKVNNMRLNSQFLTHYLSILSKPIARCVGFNILCAAFWFNVKQPKAQTSIPQLAALILQMSMLGYVYLWPQCNGAINTTTKSGELTFST